MTLREAARERLNRTLGEKLQNAMAKTFVRALLADPADDGTPAQQAETQWWLTRGRIAPSRRRHEPEQPAAHLEAEVTCVYCKGRYWVAWESRHDGKDPTAPHHKLARCPHCPV